MGNLEHTLDKVNGLITISMNGTTELIMDYLNFKFILRNAGTVCSLLTGQFYIIIMKNAVLYLII